MAEPDFTPSVPETCPAPLSLHQSLREIQQQVPALRGALPLRAPQHPVPNWVGIILVPGSGRYLGCGQHPSLPSQRRGVASGNPGGSGSFESIPPLSGQQPPPPPPPRPDIEGTWQWHQGSREQPLTGRKGQSGPEHLAAGLGGVEECALGHSERKTGASPFLCPSSWRGGQGRFLKHVPP